MNPDNFTHKTNEALVAAHEMASEASSIAAAGPAPFCSALLLIALSSSRAAALVFFPLISPLILLRILLFV